MYNIIIILVDIFVMDDKKNSKWKPWEEIKIKLIKWKLKTRGKYSEEYSIEERK